MNKNYLLALILILVIGGGSFFGGMKYQQSKLPRMGQFGRNENPMNNKNQIGIGQKRMGNGQIVGEIVSLDDKTMTVKMTDGSSKIVILSDSTKVSRSVQIEKSELKVGAKIAVFGTPNADGSVTGGNIELDPAMLGQAAKLTGTPVEKN